MNTDSYEENKQDLPYIEEDDMNEFEDQDDISLIHNYPNVPISLDNITEVSNDDSTDTKQYDTKNEKYQFPKYIDEMSEATEIPIHSSTSDTLETADNGSVHTLATFPHQTDSDDSSVTLSPLMKPIPGRPSISSDGDHYMPRLSLSSKEFVSDDDSETISLRSNDTSNIMNDSDLLDSTMLDKDSLASSSLGSNDIRQSMIVPIDYQEDVDHGSKVSENTPETIQEVDEESSKMPMNTNDGAFDLERSSNFQPSSIEPTFQNPFNIPSHPQQSSYLSSNMPAFNMNSNSMNKFPPPTEEVTLPTMDFNPSNARIPSMMIPPTMPSETNIPSMMIPPTMPSETNIPSMMIPPTRPSNARVPSMMIPPVILQNLTENNEFHPNAPSLLPSPPHFRVPRENTKRQSSNGEKYSLENPDYSLPRFSFHSQSSTSSINTVINNTSSDLSVNDLVETPSEPPKQKHDFYSDEYLKNIDENSIPYIQKHEEQPSSPQKEENKEEFNINKPDIHHDSEPSISTPTHEDEPLSYSMNSVQTTIIHSEEEDDDEIHTISPMESPMPESESEAEEQPSQPQPQPLPQSLPPSTPLIPSFFSTMTAPQFHVDESLLPKEVQNEIQRSINALVSSYNDQICFMNSNLNYQIHCMIDYSNKLKETLETQIQQLNLSLQNSLHNPSISIPIQSSFSTSGTFPNLFPMNPMMNMNISSSYVPSMASPFTLSTPLFSTIQSTALNATQSTNLNTSFMNTIQYKLHFNDNEEKTISSIALKSYPDSLWSHLITEKTSPSSVVSIPHSSTYFETISSYMETGTFKLPSIESMNQEELYSHLYYELNYYHLPIPSEFDEFIKEHPKEQLWNQSTITFSLLSNHKEYTIQKNDLESFSIYDSYFQQYKNESELQLSREGVFLLTESISSSSMDLLISYLTTKSLDISEDLLVYYYDIVHVFEFFHIPLSMDEQLKYTKLTKQYFKETTLLVDTYTKCIIEWLGEHKQFHLLYKYIDLFLFL